MCVCVCVCVYIYKAELLTPENNRIESRIIFLKHIWKSKFLSCLPNYCSLYEQGLNITAILSSYGCGKGKITWYLKGLTMTINTVRKNKHKKLHQKVFPIIFTKFCYKHIWPAHFNNIFIIIY